MVSENSFVSNVRIPSRKRKRDSFPVVPIPPRIIELEAMPTRTQKETDELKFLRRLVDTQHRERKHIFILKYQCLF